ncbi:MAG: hypothetical protein NT136_02490 [Candidatus Moranbacteria bacterium]|nr:hypothetical protein [Candidatus Moranbacteria bacterium]
MEKIKNPSFFALFKKKGVLPIAGVTLLIIGGLIIWGINQPKKAEAPASPANGIVYYYGQECSHCQEVVKFLEENKIAEKVSFSKKEVWHNRENAAELEQRAEECGLDKSKVGVPFLYAQGKCLIGTPDVVDFFKKEAEIP